jgi:hypothetical protein
MPNQREIDGIVAEQGFDAFEDNVCLLDRDNRIVYCNQAWDRFALANHGEQATFEHVYGIDVLSVCSDELRGFYQQLLHHSRTKGESVFHGYCCSSPTHLRIARMTVRPHGQYLSVQHVMLDEKQHTDRPRVFDEHYVSEGLVKMCANCRRTFNYKESTWEWIPQLLVIMPRNTSHGLCKPCGLFYFGPKVTNQTS